MNPYELLLIITPDYDESEAEALTDQVKGMIENGGTLLKVDPWGKKRLAYPIRKRNDGYYVLYIFESAPSFVAELNQSLRVIETILRYMIVQYEDDINKLKTELDAETGQTTSGDEAQTTSDGTRQTTPGDGGKSEDTAISD